MDHVRTLATAIALVVALLAGACGSSGTSNQRDRGDNCDPSYPTLCLAPPPPKLNCGDVREKNFKVTGTDPHGFDRDKDGIGCEQQ